METNLLTSEMEMQLNSKYFHNAFYENFFEGKDTNFKEKCFKYWERMNNKHHFIEEFLSYAIGHINPRLIRIDLLSDEDYEALIWLSKDLRKSWINSKEHSLGFRLKVIYEWYTRFKELGLNPSLCTKFYTDAVKNYRLFGLLKGRVDEATIIDFINTYNGSISKFREKLYTILYANVMESMNMDFDEVDAYDVYIHSNYKGDFEYFYTLYKEHVKFMRHKIALTLDAVSMINYINLGLTDTELLTCANLIIKQNKHRIQELLSGDCVFVRTRDFAVMFLKEDK